MANSDASTALLNKAGLCNNYLEGGGVGKPEGGHRGKSQLERGGLDVKFH